MENTCKEISMSLKSVRPCISGLLSCLMAFALWQSPALAGDVEDSIKAIQKEALAKQMDGDLDGAIDSYESACNLAKNEYGENSKIVGAMYLDMGILALDSAKQFDRAENFLNKAARLNDNSVTAHLKLAELLTLRGTNEKNLQARREIEKVLMKNPRSQPARQALAMFYQQQGQPMLSFHQYSYLNQVMNGKSIPRDKFGRGRSIPVEPKAELVAPAVFKMPSAPAGYVKPLPVPVKPIAKPRPKPSVVPKPKPKPRAITQPVMRELPPPAEPKPARTKPAKGRNGLVPPPPPVMPMFGSGFAPPPPAPGTSSPAFNLKTEAQIKKKNKPAPEPAEEKAEKPAEKPRATSGDSPDFLLDWASERKKK